MLKNDRSLHRKYVDCEINKLFAEISCDTKHHCVCSNGRNGAKGDIGMTGPKGEPGINGGPGMKGDKGDQGDSGVSVIPINNTVFVDTQFGTAAGTRENLSNPVQTLQQALAIALPGDTIYVQPGVYLESTLILLNNVNWFFTKGATFSGATYLFSDNGANVNSMIEGYGRFISGGGILNISGASNITFNGTLVNISGTVPGFVVSNAVSTSELTLSVDEIISDTSTVVQITGNTKINWESQTINTLGSIIDINNPAFGSGNFIVQSIVGGDPTVDSNRGLFYNDSEFFDLNIVSNMITSNSYNYAINVSLSATIPNGNNTSIDVQLLRVLGGVILVNGVLGVSQFNQPKVILNASIILISPLLPNSSPIVPFLINQANVNIKSSILYNRGNPSIFVFSSNTSLLVVDVNIILLSTSNLLQTSGGFGIIRIISKLISIVSGILLSNTGNNFVVIDSTSISVGTPPGVSAVVSNVPNGEVTLNSHRLTIIGNGVAGTFNNLIDHVTGSLHMNVDIYRFDGTFVTAILSRAGTAYLNINNVSSNSANNMFYQTSANSYLTSENINLPGTAITLELSGNLVCKISNITITGSGNALTLINNSRCSGYIGNISVFRGSVIVSNSSSSSLIDPGVISLTFNEILSTGTLPGVIADTFILTGNGYIRLKGNTINSNNAVVAFLVRNGCELSLNVNNLICNQNRSLFDISAPTGGVYLEFMNISIPQSLANINIFNVLDGFLTMKGGNINIGSNEATGFVFNVVGTGVLTCNVQNIRSPGVLLFGLTNGTVNFTFDTLQAGGSSFVNNVIRLERGDYYIRGLAAFITVDNGPGQESFIFCGSDASATIIVDTVRSQGIVAIVTTNGNFWYKTESSIVNSVNDDPVISINSNLLTSEYTFSGLLKTNGSDAIHIDVGSTNNIIRLISSTLVSTLRSIHNAGILPQDIIIVPSIANVAAVNIVQKPAGTLLIDPAVQ